jgi:small basic protein
MPLTTRFFLSGCFIANVLLAAGLVAVGEKFGLETGVGESRISVMMVGAGRCVLAANFQQPRVLRRMIIDRYRESRDRRQTGAYG